jgi:hypothetical protein
MNKWLRHEQTWNTLRPSILDHNWKQVADEIDYITINECRRRSAPVDPRILSHQQAKAFYDRFGNKPDWQSFYEDVATEALIRNGEFDRGSRFRVWLRHGQIRGETS